MLQTRFTRFRRERVAIERASWRLQQTLHKAIVPNAQSGPEESWCNNNALYGPCSRRAPLDGEQRPGRGEWFVPEINVDSRDNLEDGAITSSFQYLADRYLGVWE